MTKIEDENFNGFQVTNRQTGMPIKNATFNINTSNENYTISKVTDSLGLIKVQKIDQHYWNSEGYITKKNDTLILNNINLERYEQDQDWYGFSKLVLDRPIYRPNQNVHFKGYLYQVKNGKKSVVPNTKCLVVIYDSKGNELQEFNLVTNEFGTLSGNYQLPKEILTGEFSIEMDEPDDIEDEHSIAFWDHIDDFEYEERIFYVEEYKRPRFEVVFNKVTENFKFGDSIIISGQAKSFFGNPISNAEVSFNFSKYGKTIFNSKTRTDQNGNFELSYLSEKIENSSNYHQEIKLKVDITDTNGETQSGQKVFRLGNYNLDLNAYIPFKINDHNSKISLTSKNLNDGYIPSKGTVKIYKDLSNPYPLTRKWSIPEFQTINKNEFDKYFPKMQYKKEENQNNKILVKEIEFEIIDKLELDLNTSKWTNAKYSLEIKAIAENGDEDFISRSFEYFVAEKGDKIAKNLFEYELINGDVNNTGKVSLQLTPAFKNTLINVNFIDQNNFIYPYQVNVSKDSIVNFNLPKHLSGDLKIKLHTNTHNRFYSQDFDLILTKENLDLTIETLRFNKVLKPNTEELWTFKVKNLDGHAEVLAGMYDESLDDFFTVDDKDNEYFNLDWKPIDYKLYGSDYDENYMTFNVSNVYSHYPKIKRHNAYDINYKTIKRNYLQLNYFGFDFRNNPYSNKNYLKSLRLKKGVKKQDLGNVSGLITDSYGLPLPGVNIIVKGTTRGVQTDFDGFYSIDVEKGETLVFSYVGFKEQAFEIKDKTSLNFMMEEDMNALDEVVITGYTSQIKKSATGSALTITYTSQVEFENNLMYILQGQTSGLNISGFSGQPGSAIEIRIRGNSSLNAGNKPLYVIDGVPMEIKNLNLINPEHINELTVLKDASATAMYGARGANGVIIITTKYGSQISESDNVKSITLLSKDDVEQVEARKKFDELAFFIPHLKTDKKNELSIKLSAPESLTRWKIQLLAHDKNTKSGYKKLNAITTKELTVTPNLPRFLREKDQINFSTKVSNRSDKQLIGDVHLLLFDAKDQSPLGSYNSQYFNLDKKTTQNFDWLINIPQKTDSIRYKIYAKTQSFSDGEEGVLTVFKHKILITETLPFNVNAKSKKEIDFKSIKENTSSTLEHKSLTLDFNSNPVLSALTALPYLQNFEYDCAEQTFSKYYANVLGHHLVNSNPQIKTFITSQKERSNLTYLLDYEQLVIQENILINKLQNLQLSNGGFGWFSANGQANLFITRHIVATYGHLLKLGVHPNSKQKLDKIISKALKFLDNEFLKTTKNKNSKVSLNYNEIHYLYARSFYLESNPIDKEINDVINLNLGLLKKQWVEKNLYSQGLLALVFKRFNDNKTAKDILNALEQTSILDTELGRYWKGNQMSYYWYQAEIETQALMIEAFSEIDSNKKVIDELKKWILSKKQSASWATTKATTAAIYALVKTGSDWLNAETNTVISLGKEVYKSVDDKSGKIKITVKGEDIKPEMSEIKINNKSSSVGFGSVFWEYYEELDHIKEPSKVDKLPLMLNKTLYVIKKSSKGEDLIEINEKSNLKVGDIVKIRIAINSKNDLEFVHLEDMRASGFEPINVLSKYKWQDGLGYYESTKDTVTDFFFDELPKGVYTIEYNLRVNNAGKMSNGISTMGCMYAPKFRAHSQSNIVHVNR